MSYPLVLFLVLGSHLRFPYIFLVVVLIFSLWVLVFQRFHGIAVQCHVLIAGVQVHRLLHCPALFGGRDPSWVSGMVCCCWVSVSCLGSSFPQVLPVEELVFAPIPTPVLLTGPPKAKKGSAPKELPACYITTLQIVTLCALPVLDILSINVYPPSDPTLPLLYIYLSLHVHVFSIPVVKKKESYIAKYIEPFIAKCLQLPDMLYALAHS